jgi:hypothetical protein
MELINLKKIISVFIKLPTSEITGKTIIDTTVIQGSVLFHRMISRVNDVYDIQIENIDKIKSFNDLITQIEIIINKKIK